MAQVQTHVQIQAPETFNFERAEEWPRWIKRFERYITASGLNSKDGETQVNTLIYCMGEKADDILTSFNLTADQAKDFKVVKERFDKFFIVRNNVIFERAKFNSRYQKEGEPVEDFITALHTLVETCDYPETFVCEALRDRVVVGIRDKTLSQALQLDAGLTLQKAVEKVRLKEAVIKQQAELVKFNLNNDNVDVKEGSSVDAVEGKGAKKKHYSKPFVCYRCGSNSPHGRRLCPAVNAKCRNCNRFGHYEKVCKAKDVNAVNQETEPEDYAFMGTVDTKAPNP